MDTARSWMLRVNEPGFDDWETFTRWLEADSTHLQAYETALDEDVWAGEILSRGEGANPPILEPISAINENPPVRGRARVLARPRNLFGGAIAASLAAVLVWSTLLSGPQLAEIATEPGEQRSITLADGSRVQVNGNSRITYDPEEPRRITLARGEALFDVDHDAANPFIVTVGETRLIDAGTIFNVEHDIDALEVSVAEGVVIYDHEEEEVRLEPGDRLVRGAPGSAVEVVRMDPGAVGAWREGMLHYENAALATIARDLSRAVGKPVRAVGGAEQMRYSGTLVVEGSEQELLARAGALLGVTITETSDTWEMKPGDDPPS